LGNCAASRLYEAGGSVASAQGGGLPPGCGVWPSLGAQLSPGHWDLGTAWMAVLIFMIFRGLCLSSLWFFRQGLQPCAECWELHGHWRDGWASRSERQGNSVSDCTILGGGALAYYAPLAYLVQGSVWPQRRSPRPATPRMAAAYISGRSPYITGTLGLSGAGALIGLAMLAVFGVFGSTVLPVIYRTELLAYLDSCC